MTSIGASTVPQRVRRLLCLAVVVAFALPMVAVATPAYACSCVESLTDGRALQRADVVFEGTLVDDRNLALTGTRELTFDVDAVYKGEAYPKQRVLTQASSASCGLDVAGSGRYLVFARGGGVGFGVPGPGALRADLCGGTRIGAAAGELGPRQPPLAMTEVAARRPVNVIVAGAAALLVGIGLVVARRQVLTRRRALRPAA